MEEETLSKLMPCKICGKEISKTARFCPNCGEHYEYVEPPHQASPVIEEVTNELHFWPTIGLFIKATFLLILVGIGLLSGGGILKRLFNL